MLGCGGLGAIALTEPGGGSDLQSLATAFARTAGGLRINGKKKWISCGQFAGVFLVVPYAVHLVRARGTMRRKVLRAVPVLLIPAGPLVYWAYLGSAGGEPLAFAQAQSTVGGGVGV
mgnify:CR=1 FL=1